MTLIWKTLLLLCLHLTLICLSQTATLNLEGDVLVQGLFGGFEPEPDGTCATGQYSEVYQGSVMNAEAVKWYFDQLNKNGDLPFTIGLKGHATCWNDGVAAQHAIQFLGQAMEQTGQASKPCIGVIGPETSGETGLVSSILSAVPPADRLLQVSYSATAAELNDRDKYPNLVRVVPDDNIQIEIMVQVMQQLQWNRIAIVKENSVYGNDAAKILQKMAESVGICVTSIFSIETPTGVFDAIESITQNRVTGLVYFGASQTANKIFRALDPSQLSEVPVVMMSEGFNMDTGTFETSLGNVISTTKGTLALAPLYRTVTEFQTYWKSIFVNSTVFNEQVVTNPWLRDVFYLIAQCEDKNCPFSEIEQSVVDVYFATQPLFVQYAILAAHTVAKAARNTHSALCGDASGLCERFVETFATGALVEEVKDMQLDIATDFNWRPASLNDGTSFVLNASGGIHTLDNRANYQLYNFRRVADGTSFGLFKLGEFSDGTIDVDVDQLRDYDSAGVELRWPDVRKVQCPVRRRCSECIPDVVLHEGYIFEEGDAYVIGINPIFERDGLRGCGSVYTTNTYQVLEAVRFAVQKVNDKSSVYGSLFPNMKIGFIGLTTCNNPIVIQSKIYDLFKNGLLLKDGSRLNVNGKVIGFVGDVGSSVSIAVAETLSRLQYVQISYGSTSPALSDRNKYPYFMRVVTPDDEQAKAMILIMKKLEANYIQIVYSEGAYGEGGAQKVQQAAYDNEICVRQAIMVGENDVNTVYESLRKYPEARLVVIIIRSHVVMPLLDALKSQMNSPGEFYFIGSEAWAKNPGVLDNDQRQITLGSLTLALEMYQDKELLSHVLQLSPSPVTENPWSLLYLQEKRQCYFELSFDKTQPEVCTESNRMDQDLGFRLDTWATAAYVATQSLLIGASEQVKVNCGSAASGLCPLFTSDITGLVNAIKRVKLDIEGNGGSMKVFDSKGDGNVGYRIYNIQRNPDRPQELLYKEVGRYPLEGIFTFEEDHVVHHTASFQSVCPNTHACDNCSKSDANDADSGDGSSVDGLTIALAVLFGVATVVAIVLAVLLFIIRREGLCFSDPLYLHPTSPTIDTLDSGITSTSRNSGGTASGGTFSSGSGPGQRPEVVGLEQFKNLSVADVGIASGVFHTINPCDVVLEQSDTENVANV